MGIRLADFDPADYPRQYRVSQFAKVPVFWQGIIVIVLITLNTLHYPHLLSFVVPLAAIFIGYVWGNQLFATYTLYPDRIERKPRLGKLVVMRREDIAGRLGARPWLIAKGDERNFYFRGIQPDSKWNVWMDSLPDLDAASTTADLANPALGNDPDQRSRRWQRGQRTGQFLFFASIVAMVWAVITAEGEGYVSHANATILVALPWLAILYIWRWGDILDADILRSRNIKTLKLRLSNQILVTCVMVFCSMMGLLAFTYSPGHHPYIDGEGPSVLAFAALIFAIFTVAFFLVSRLARIPIVALLCAVLLLPVIPFYGMFATFYVNGLGASEQDRFFESAVTEKRILVDSRRNETFQVYLAPWGPYKSGDRFNVRNAGELARYHVSEKVCIRLRTGLLGISTSTVEDSCPTG